MKSLIVIPPPHWMTDDRAILPPQTQVARNDQKCVTNAVLLRRSFQSLSVQKSKSHNRMESRRESGGSLWIWKVQLKLMTAFDELVSRLLDFLTVIECPTTCSAQIEFVFVHYEQN